MRDKQSNPGWCRTMYYSSIQQLVRGDPLYYLISYPYYTKYTKLGDPIAFPHIDLNIVEVVHTGKGADIL
jgi:hypothetical protein